MALPELLRISTKSLLEEAQLVKVWREGSGGKVTAMQI